MFIYWQCNTNTKSAWGNDWTQSKVYKPECVYVNCYFFQWTIRWTQLFLLLLLLSCYLHAVDCFSISVGKNITVFLANRQYGLSNNIERLESIAQLTIIFIKDYIRSYWVAERVGQLLYTNLIKGYTLVNHRGSRGFQPLFNFLKGVNLQHLRLFVSNKNYVQLYS